MCVYIHILALCSRETEPMPLSLSILPPLLYIFSSLSLPLSPCVVLYAIIWFVYCVFFYHKELVHVTTEDKRTEIYFEKLENQER